jgi:ankyrin repeat protein
MLLFVAALQGDVHRLEWLINQGADMNARYTGQPLKAKADKIIEATVLHLVVAMGLTNSAEVLLCHGIDIQAKMRRTLGAGPIPREQYAEMTALHLAAMEGHTKIVEMLLTQGADKYAKMQFIESCEAKPGRDKVAKLGASMSRERFITPMEIAYEMSLKGHARDSVLSLLSNWK